MATFDNYLDPAAPNYRARLESSPADLHAFENEFVPALKRATRAFEGQFASLQRDQHLTPLGKQDRYRKAAAEARAVTARLRKKRQVSEDMLASEVATRMNAGSGRELTADEREARALILNRAMSLSAEARSKMYFGAMRNGDDFTRRALESAPASLELLSADDRERGVRLRRPAVEASIPNYAQTRDRLAFEDWILDAAERHISEMAGAVIDIVPKELTTQG